MDISLCDHTFVHHTMHSTSNFRLFAYWLNPQLRETLYYFIGRTSIICLQYGLTILPTPDISEHPSPPYWRTSWHSAPFSKQGVCFEAFWGYDCGKMIQESGPNLRPNRRRCVDDDAEQEHTCDGNANEQQQAALSEVNPKRQQRRRQNERADISDFAQDRKRTEEEEKRIAQLEANARRQRLRRENETAEERAARLRANALRQRKRRQKETAEQRAARLQANAQRQQRLRLKARSARQETVLPSVPTLLPPQPNICLQNLQQPPLPYPFTLPCDTNFTCAQ
ncbi:hypothetical protein GCK32_002753 [Trichostrongylus colubriformis]|uniref:Uncharacterized protein n=1 Tax=Trichostrongylus colubriformis TaxID=6319 RepID=A0AAN8G5I6_TRICO